MDEAQWKDCALPGKMLAFLEGPDDGTPSPLGAVTAGGAFSGRQSDRASHRKFRLFCAACTQRMRPFANDKSVRALIDEFDRYAKEESDKQDHPKSDGPLRSSSNENKPKLLIGRAWKEDPVSAALFAGQMTWLKAGIVARDSVKITMAQMNEDDHWFAGFVGIPDPHWESIRREEQQFQCDLIRDIFGNPFRSVTVDGNWLSPPALRIAQRIYEEQAFERMPELGKALEAAGCAHADVLTHCLSAKPHAQGCWVIDLLLGMS